MEYWAEVWDELLNIISGNKAELMKNPFVWVFIALAGIGIYALYDVPDKVNKNGLGSVVRQLLQVILDTSSDIINALRSITGFLGVVRLLLFGKLNQKTLQVLINYAIIFMSMASFTTTLAGLWQMVGPVLGAFISFGVQVSILICGIKIANHTDKKRGEAEKVVTVSKYSFDSGLAQMSILQKQSSGSIEQREKAELNEDIGKKNKKFGIGSLKSSMREKSILPFLVLVVSVLVSSSFSYSFMFGEFIIPHLTYDDHFQSIKEVQNIILEYSEELNQYRTDLVEILTLYNDNVEEWMDLKENSPYIQLEREKRLLNEIDELKDDRERALLEYYETEENSSERNVAEERIDDLESQIGDKERELGIVQEDLYEDTVGNNRRMAYESITVLTDFYANPGEISEEKEKELRQNFSYLQQSEAAFQNNAVSGWEKGLDDAGRTELINAFENYMSLSKFLEEQGGGRISFTEVQDKMNIDYSEDFSSDDYQNATNDVLIEMINKLNSIPILTPVENVWSESIVQAPPQTKYIDTINDLYRDNSGNVLVLERAAKKLWEWRKDRGTGKLVFILALLAVIFDSLIVALTMFRERKYSFANNAELQRLLGILFIDDSISRESERQKRSQSLCLTLGFALGILIFTIYQVGGYSKKNSFEQNTFSLICFIAIGLIVGMIIYKAYCKIYNKLHAWEQESIFHQWKEIFLPNEESEKRLKEKCEQIKCNEIKVSMPQGMDDIENLLAFWMSALGRRLFLSYFYPGFVMLFGEMEMKKCIRTSIVRELREGKYTDKETWIEKINLPCLSEHKVAEAGAKVEFSILKRKHLVEFAFENEKERVREEGYYILTERFWYLLYDAILLRIAEGRITEHDIEEELWDDADEEEQI